MFVFFVCKLNVYVDVCLFFEGVWVCLVDGDRGKEVERTKKKRKEKKNKKSWIEKIFLSHFLAFLVEFVYNWLSLAETPYQHT